MKYITTTNNISTLLQKTTHRPSTKCTSEDSQRIFFCYDNNGVINLY